jgi:glycosyltransferase involved in cell wall biosynthesis
LVNSNTGDNVARTTNNPLKEKFVPPAPDVTLAVTTHYTDTLYHAERMGVVKMCLDTMLAGVQGINYELVIWDNGSTPEFRRMLLGYKPEVFVQSVNVGAHDARHGLAGIARGKVVSFTDDDILFHPDWFSLQLEILKTYPNVGLVSGSPQRTAFRAGVASNIAWARQNASEVQMTTGSLIPEVYERDYAMSIGRSWDRQLSVASNFTDTLLEYKGVKAWAHGHHMQLLGHLDVVKKYMQRSAWYLDNKKLFNVDLDNDGLLQLTTYRRTAVHIGNVIDENILGIHKSFGCSERVTA